MKLLIVVSLLAAVSFESVELRQIRPRHSERKFPVRPQGWLPTEGRITNGEAALPKQFPYQVGLSLEFPEGYYWCGGSLLSDEWIVTAAHCTDGVISLEAILGSLKSDPNNAVGEVVVKINANQNNVIVHTNYDDWTLENDISLIRLPNPVQLSDYIQPVSLPKSSGAFSTYAGNTGVASGWGLTSDHSNTISPTLQWIDVPVISNTQCAMYFGTLAPSVICISTKGTKKSICSGDSGGPLVLDGTNTLIGITSFGVSMGCEKNWPAGFTRVTSFLDWIEENAGIKS